MVGIDMVGMVCYDDVRYRYGYGVDLQRAPLDEPVPDCCDVVSVLVVPEVPVVVLVDEFPPGGAPMSPPPEGAPLDKV